MSEQTNNQKIFVVVPSYNHAPFIERCLRSIIKQSLPPSQLLVIDDGSKDDSPRVIEKILKDCPFPAEFVARENRGLCRTLNEGFERSRGEYFAYLGSDDVWLPGFLENRRRLLIEEPDAVLGYGNAFLIDENDRILESSADWNAYKGDHGRRMLLAGVAPVSSTVFYRRAALERVRWNEDSRLEDYELYLKLSVEGKFAFDPAVHAAWRWHGYNTSGDMPLMLHEVVAAQRRNASLLGIDEPELQQIEREVKLFYAENFARHGRKKEAFELIRENWRAASDSKSLAKMLLFLLVPAAALKRRKDNYKEKATQKHGVLRV